MKVKNLSNNLLYNRVVVCMFIFYKYLSMWFNYTNKWLNVLLIGAVILSILVLLFRSYHKNIFKSSFIIIIFIVITFYKSYRIDLLVSFLFAILFYKEENGDREFIKAFTLPSAFLFAFTLVLYFFGYLNNFSSQRIVEGILVIRNSLGFSHVNALFMYFMPIMLGCLFLVKSNKQKLLLVIFDLLAIIFYKATLCRTGFFLIVIMNVLLLFEKRLKKMKVLLIFAKFAFPILTILSLIIGIRTGNDFSNPINAILSYRPYYILSAFNDWGIHLFGYGILNTVLLDNGYLTILLSFGLLSYLFYCYFHVKTFESLIENGFFLALSISCFYLLIENYLVFVNNFIFTIQFMYFLKMAISKKGKIKKMYKEVECYRTTD